MDVICRRVALGAEPGPEAFFWRHRELPGLAWLDGGPGSPSLFTWGPGAAVPAGSDWPTRLRGLLRPGPQFADAPFAGGVLGFVGYEAGRHVERMPVPQGAGPLPELGLRRYEGGLWFDPRIGRWTAAGTAAFVDEAVARLDEVDEPAPEAAMGKGRRADLESPEGFERAVHQVQAWIRAGDCYQVNLSRRMVIEGIGDPALAYLRLRRSAPADHGCWLSVDGGAVLSNSPERFLRVSGDRVESLPIKGTRPRGSGAQDRAWAAELAGDPKERAELTMIVDLVRNDLGRVCRPGSIATAPRRVYALPTVHHAAQRVSGRLETGCDAVDALVACFPPGSVTGAPKVRAMAILGALEPVPRGVSYGALGYVADSGELSLSVAIRTATVVGDRAWVHVGGGIVADSDPSREWDETRWKGLALLRALTGATPEASRHPDRP